MLNDGNTIVVAVAIRLLLGKKSLARKPTKRLEKPIARKSQSRQLWTIARSWENLWVNLWVNFCFPFLCQRRWHRLVLCRFFPRTQFLALLACLLDVCLAG